MVTLTINLTPDQFEKLDRLATEFNIAPEELVQVSVQELIAQPEHDFEKTLEYVLRKNAELYRKLA